MSSGFYKAPEFETIQLHGGQVPDSSQLARAVPIYSSASFCFKDSAHAASLMNLQRVPGLPTHIYTRISNPTVEVFEQRMAKLEGGFAATATASGHSAIFLAVTTIAEGGDNIVSSTSLYGGTFNLFKVTLKKFGISTKFVSSTDPGAFAAAIDEKTKAIFIESIGNPGFVFYDIPALAKVAHDHGIPLIVDNTFGMGGYLIRPFEHGADIIIHSATKWIGGHGTTIGGVIIDSGRFPWAKSGRFPSFTTPNESYNGVIFSEKFGPMAYILKIRMEMMRDLGPCMNPFGAFLLLQGLETLSLRADRHSSNAMALARWLAEHPKVSWVSYLGLELHPSHELARKFLHPGVFGGVLCFGANGGRETAAKLIDNFKLASHLTNVGDAKTLVIHPASTIHAQLSKEDLIVAGVSLDMIRVSVGLEAIGDIIADFEGAFAATFPNSASSCTCL